MPVQTGWRARARSTRTPWRQARVKEVAQEHSAATEAAKVPDAAEHVRLQAGQLLAEEFSLLEKNVDYDVRLVNSWA